MDGLGSGGGAGWSLLLRLAGRGHEGRRLLVRDGRLLLRRLGLVKQGLLDLGLGWWLLLGGGRLRLRWWLLGRRRWLVVGCRGLASKEDVPRCSLHGLRHRRACGELLLCGRCSKEKFGRSVSLRSTRSHTHHRTRSLTHARPHTQGEAYQGWEWGEKWWAWGWASARVRPWRRRVLVPPGARAWPRVPPLCFRRLRSPHEPPPSPRLRHLPRLIGGSTTTRSHGKPLNGWYCVCVQYSAVEQTFLSRVLEPDLT